MADDANTGGSGGPGGGAFRPPPPVDGEVHVWRAEIEGTGLPRGVAAVLTGAETERAGRLGDPAQGRAWAWTRAWLRHVLGGYTGLAPGRVPLGRAAGGKPFLGPGTARPRLRFNLSHSGGIALLAVVAGREVGIDVEAVAPRRNLDALVGTTCSAAERARLEGLDPDRRLLAFLACWTRKEAWLKGLGVGLSVEPSAVTVSLPGDGPVRLLATPAHPGAVDDWTLVEVDVDPGYVATLAVAGGPTSLRRFPTARG